ncbi:MAG: cell division protein ZapD [Betaproteobacteria bacterium]|nr:cell division protein ZapD [Betaproteobacteria bacterium]
MVYVIGLTGGIGSGKSAVARAFEERGAAIVDSDLIAHALSAPAGAAIPAIRQAFGEQMIAPDGAMDRARMRDLVFSDAGAKARLEAILHPLITAESARQTTIAPGPYVIQVVPLLVETGMGHERFDRILVVDCDEALQIERVLARGGLDQAGIRDIMATQASRHTRLSRADDVLVNEGSLGEMEVKVELMHRRYLLQSRDQGPGQARPAGLASTPENRRESAGPHHAVAPVITYEYPLNERVRTLLRLENLFERVRYFLARGDRLDHHMVLLTTFEILEVAGRADLKSDLLQELERQKQVLSSFRGNPEIAEDALNHVLADIEQCSHAMFAMSGKIGQHLRENEWLMSIKQRTGIPGGACEFDLPSYHYWMHRDAESRLADLHGWINPLLPIRDGGAIVLRLLREGGKASKIIAQHGAFSQMLGGKVAQMVRIKLPRDMQCIPEISANKYALNIRFLMYGLEPRPRIVEANVEFELTFCNL